MSLIEINNKSIYRDGKKILSDVNLTVNAEDFVLFSGESGSGKSTLINEIVSEREDLTGRVFQDPTLQFAMETPYLELIFLYENLKAAPNKIETLVLNTLKKFDLLDKKDQNVQTLSGGEQQRLALAESIATNAELIILDEPFASVDKKNKIKMINEIKKAFDSGAAFIVADHDISTYRELANKLYRFENSTIKQIEKNKFSSFLKNSAQPVKFESSYNGVPVVEFKNFEISNLIGKTDLVIPKNSKTLLIGDNGSGKTSLFKSIFNIQKYSGSILIDSGSKLLAFQHSADSFITLNVGDEIEFAKKKKLNPLQRKIPYESFLNEKKQQTLYTLSGGEQKKIQLYSLFVQNPDILFLDEPFSGLDEKSIQVVVDLISNFKGTLVIISHQFKYLQNIINNVIQIKNKKIENIFEVKL